MSYTINVYFVIDNYQDPCLDILINRSPLIDAINIRQSKEDLIKRLDILCEDPLEPAIKGKYTPAKSGWPYPCIYWAHVSTFKVSSLDHLTGKILCCIRKIRETNPEYFL